VESAPESEREDHLSLDISKIHDFLYLSAWPRREHLDEILRLNIRLILSMNWLPPHKSLAQPPLHLLWLPTFDTPLVPIPLAALRRGVEAALPVIHSGGAVLAHCRKGVHRGAAMASCVLIALGWSATEAMRLVRLKRPAADPEIWYIASRIRKFERYWHFRHS